MSRSRRKSLLIPVGLIFFKYLLEVKFIKYFIEIRGLIHFISLEPFLMRICTIYGILFREQRTCTAACCRDDLSENSSTHTSHSSRVSHTSHRVQVEFNEEENDTNGSSLDFYEAKVEANLFFDRTNNFDRLQTYNEFISALRVPPASAIVATTSFSACVAHRSAKDSWHQPRI